MNEVCFVDLNNKTMYCKGTITIHKGGAKYDKNYMDCDICVVHKQYKDKEYKYFTYVKWLGNLK